jgi:carbon-monoxide dehydrogenase medium subunit
VKPAPFDYVAPGSVGAAVEQLADGTATVLAGGQSLVIDMVYRTVTPRRLVDINRVPGLDRLVLDGRRWRVGALVRHADLERPGGTDPVRRLLARAAPYIAHPPIRARGTFAGSVAWGQPSAEWNAVVAALGATVQTRSASGGREVAAADWYVGACATARRPDELVVEVALPVPTGPCGVGFAEHRRTHAAFADVAVAVAVAARGSRVSSAGIGIVGTGPVPVRAAAVEAALEHAPLAAAAATAHQALARPYRTHRDAVVAELVRRAVQQAITDLAEQA